MTWAGSACHGSVGRAADGARAVQYRGGAVDPGPGVDEVEGQHALQRWRGRIRTAGSGMTVRVRVRSWS
jgi:hypothetical protein